jgi:hypothetical protein
VAVSKIDRFGRSVLHLNQQLAALMSRGVRFIATSQSLDTDEKNPTSRLLLQILASVAEFEREMIRERTLSGIRAAPAAGKEEALHPGDDGGGCRSNLCGVYGNCLVGKGCFSGPTQEADSGGIGVRNPRSVALMLERVSGGIHF